MPSRRHNLLIESGADLTAGDPAGPATQLARPLQNHSGWAAR